MKLYEIAKMVRSKNAGPFVITIDILFDNEDAYNRVLQSGVLGKEQIASIYGIDEKSISFHRVDGAFGLKYSFPRKHACGDFEDNDVYGCQYHAPLVMLEIP